MKTQKRAKFVAELPDEVITTHIFPRLCVKSVGRCRCVSKPWRSVLKSPEFAKTHLKFHAHDPEDLIIQSLDSFQISTFTDEDAAAVSRKVKFPTIEAFTDQAVPRKVKFRLFQGLVWSEIVGSCNGLILIASDKKYFTTILVNPVTLEYVNVPQVSNPLGEIKPPYGLGYDSCSDDYKIVRLSRFRDDGDQVYVYVYVYSVKMKSWRRVGPHTPYLPIWSNSGVFLNGCIHWMAGSCTIAAFDLAREKFNQIPLPSGVVVDEEYVELLLKIKVFEGRLALIHRVPSRPAWAYEPHSKRYTDVWVMEEYGVSNSWTKLTTLNPPENGDYWSDAVSFQCMLNRDEILLKRSDMQLVAYNWRSGVRRDVAVAGYKGSLDRPSITAFRKSLVSPNALIL